MRTMEPRVGTAPLIWAERALATIAMMILISCGSSGGTEPEPDRVAEGWAAFEAGNFSGAQAAFEEAVAAQSSNGAAHNGLGWAKLQLAALPEAKTSFSTALDRGFVGVDPHAGLAIVYRDLPPVDYDAAIASANRALAVEPGYVFAHDATLDWRDLRLVLAHSLFALGRYVEANAEIVALGGSSQDSNSATFVEDLLREIERLTEVFGG
jgi:tetratricopeptide (TPR) repeat protein